ncbi:fluoride efflux transporter FluC [Actinomadura sp. 21ATH]|uniref:fluoride efflux transporter FluC n=1 Tax=Actinomadura sp. 21ATH TaxID=1735444 RepID=UPI0035BEB621
MSDDHATGRDVDLHVPARRAGTSRTAPWSTLGAVAAGGACGALARYGVAAAFGHPAGAFAWATFTVNVSGCLLIGILMVAITEVWAAHRLVRPFLGVGALGGYTTFSTYAVDAQRAVEAGSPATALVYLAVTPVCALAAVLAGARLARALLPARAEGR